MDTWFALRELFKSKHPEWFDEKNYRSATKRELEQRQRRLAREGKETERIERMIELQQKGRKTF